MGAFADQTIAQLPLDAPGAVPWWAQGHQDVTLQHYLAHRFPWAGNAPLARSGWPPEVAAVNAAGAGCEWHLPGHGGVGQPQSRGECAW